MKQIKNPTNTDKEGNFKKGLVIL